MLTDRSVRETKAKLGFVNETKTLNRAHPLHLLVDMFVENKLFSVG